MGLGHQGAHGAEGEVEREGDQGQADHPLGGGLDPLGPVWLAGLHAEPPDQDDRGDRVDHRVGAEAEQRQAAAHEGRIDRDGAGHAAPHDAEDR